MKKTRFAHFGFILLALIVAVGFIACQQDVPIEEDPVVDTTPTVTSVVVNGVAQVDQGGTATYTATVTGTNNPATTVTWTVTGGKAGTTISTAGLLTVAVDETIDGELIVKATSTVDTSKSGSKTVTVLEEGTSPIVNTVAISPTTAELIPGGTQQFTATVDGDNLAIANSVTWSLSGADGGTTIVDGLLTIGATQTEGTVTVTATSTYDTGKSASATVTVTVPSNNTTLLVILVNEEAVPVGEPGTFEEVSAAGYVGAGKVTLSFADASDVTITGEPQSNQATLQFALVTAIVTTPNWVSTFENEELAQGDIIYLKVTAGDGTTVAYYRVNVEVGTNALLASVTIGTTAQMTAQYIGSPSQTLTVNSPGLFQTDLEILTPVFTLKAVPQDSLASVEYVIVHDGTTPADTVFVSLATEGIPFDPETVGDNTYLYLKVTSQNTLNVRYYKMKIITQMKGTIKYGKPLFVDPNNPANLFYVDPVWEDEEWDFDISRVNMAESTQDYFKVNPHTSAKAKALWDDGGIYVYVDVDFTKYEDADGEEQDRPITTGGSYSYDSVEIFVNERLQVLSDSNINIGVQFRVAPYVSDDIVIINGNRTGEGAYGGALATFTNVAYNKTRVWLKDNNTVAGATNKGYQVLAYVPFGKTGADVDEVFDSNGEVIEGAKVGFELQLNTNVGDGRDGILTWNGVNTRAYQNATGFGTVTLTLDGRNRISEAKPPVIDAAASTLANAGYTDGENEPVTALEVVATGDDSLTYQWYKATSPSAIGEELVGETSATYTPTLIPPDGTDLVKDTYYYVEVINFDSSAGVGFQYASAFSNRVRIRVFKAGFTYPSPFVVDLTDQPTKNATAWTSSYSGGITFQIIGAGGIPFIPSMHTGGSYTVVFKCYNADNEEVAPANINQKFFTTAAADNNAGGEIGADGSGTAYGWASGAQKNDAGWYTFTRNLNAIVTSQEQVLAMGFGTAGAAPSSTQPSFIEIQSITFE